MTSLEAVVKNLGPATSNQLRLKVTDLATLTPAVTFSATRTAYTRGLGWGWRRCRRRFR